MYVRLMKESLVALIDVPIFLVAAVVLFHFMLITIDVLPAIRLAASLLVSLFVWRWIIGHVRAVAREESQSTAIGQVVRVVMFTVIF